MNLRPYQREALASTAYAQRRGVNKQLIVLPTGTGKTCVFAALRSFRGFHRRVMVLVHRDELATQAADKIRRWNPDAVVGMEKGVSVCEPEAQFVVASVQTLGRAGSQRLAKFCPDDFDALVIDEAHHATSKSYTNIIKHFDFDNHKDRLLLGVTATPNRGDGTGLGKVFDEVVYQMSIPDAIKDGWLVDLRGIRISTDLDLDNVRTVAGDFDQRELGESCNTPSRNRQIVKDWMLRAATRQTVVFAVDVAHAQALAREFNNQGTHAEAVWGDDPHRDTKIKAFRDGHIHVLVNCALLTEGFDAWRIQCVLNARPTKSPLLFAQIIGRGTRLPDGVNNLNEVDKSTLEKTDCLIIDVVDNSKRHSIVTLPSLFGMGNIDIQGHSVISAQNQVNEALEKNPALNLSDIHSLRELKTKAEEIDLLTVKFDPQVEANSVLQWHRGPNGSFVLLLPKKESLVILQDLVGKYTVTGTIKQQKYVRECATLGAAFVEADRLVREYAHEYLNLLKRKAAWHDDPATQAQLNLLRKLRVHVPSGISKGVAAKLITKYFAQHNNRKQGAVA